VYRKAVLHETLYRTAPPRPDPEQLAVTHKDCGLWGHLPYAKPLGPVYCCTMWHCPHCLAHVGPPELGRVHNLPWEYIYVGCLVIGIILGFFL